MKKVLIFFYSNTIFRILKYKYIIIRKSCFNKFIIFIHNFLFFLFIIISIKEKFLLKKYLQDVDLIFIVLFNLFFKFNEIRQNFDFLNYNYKVQNYSSEIGFFAIFFISVILIYF